MKRALLSGLAIAWAFGAAAADAGDASRGAQLFQAACMACHSVAPAEHLTGPSLAGVFGRKAGTAQGFLRYSDALKASGLVWDAATLERWLAAPEKLVPGTSMSFRGLSRKKDREDLIAFLETVSEGKAPAREQARTPPRRLDLKNPPPPGQVVAIVYCGDTYAVTTADGATKKIWEFNLRFKTDSSAYGPQPGKPVLLDAGMLGDRASVVFASPSEISPFIRHACR